MINQNDLDERDLKIRRGIQAVDSYFVWSVILLKCILVTENTDTCCCWSDLVHEAISEHHNVISGSLKMYSLMSWMNIKGFNLQFKYIYLLFKMSFGLVSLLSRLERALNYTYLLCL